MSEIEYGKPTAKKVSGCGWWNPAVTTRIGPQVLESSQFDSPYKARKEAERILATKKEEGHGRNG
jgi:hypothetical protein